MNLKKRLERLSGSSPTPPSTQGADPLAALRDRLQAALPAMATSVSAEATENALEARLQALGFVRTEGPLGGHFERRQEVSRVTVGAVALEAIQSIEPRVLSLLALDPRLAELDWGRALFLDTETTGLGGGAGTYAFLVGLCYASPQGLQFEQLFLRGPEDEASLLAAVRRRIEASSLVVSFNGKSYDLPLLRGRFVLNRQPPVAEGGHCDLLHLGRRVHSARLKRTSLQALEREVLGFHRQDDVPGAEVAERYGHYLRTGEGAGLVGVFEHNAWDVFSMVALTALYGAPRAGKGSPLQASDWVGYARTLRRAGALSDALTASERAVDGGAHVLGHQVRGEIFKALGERDAALRSFESALEGQQVPAAVRLALAKLYEHHRKDPRSALRVLAEDAGETPERAELRRLRLRRKLDPKS